MQTILFNFRAIWIDQENNKQTYHSNPWHFIENTNLGENNYSKNEFSSNI